MSAADDRVVKSQSATFVPSNRARNTGQEQDGVVRTLGSLHDQMRDVLSLLDSGHVYLLFEAALPNLRRQHQTRATLGAEANSLCRIGDVPSDIFDISPARSAALM